MTKHYDPEKVEALLDIIEQRKFNGHGLLEYSDAVRSSAREVPEVSEEVERYVLAVFHLNAKMVPDKNGEWMRYSDHRAALARFGQPRGRVVLAKGLRAVAALIAESRGVAGLHLNGDEAPWEELRTGGRFEDWLRDFDAAIALLDEKGEEGR